MKTIEEIHEFYNVKEGRKYRITHMGDFCAFRLYGVRKNDIFTVRNEYIFFMKFDNAKIDQGFHISTLSKCNYEEVHEILDNEERKYLSAVIKPFRDKIIRISKDIDSDNDEFIYIVYQEMDEDETNGMFFPKFPKGKMYKGMKNGEEYTLEELGL